MTKEAKGVVIETCPHCNRKWARIAGVSDSPTNVCPRCRALGQPVKGSLLSKVFGKDS